MLREQIANGWQKVRTQLPAAPLERSEAAGWHSPWGWRASLREGLSGRSLELEQIQEEVAAEGRRQIVIASADPALPPALLAHLRQQPAPPPANGRVQHEGLFTLVHLPAARPATAENDTDAEDDFWDATDLLMQAEDADCLLYLWRWADGWQANDAHWCARLRALGVPLVPVALEAPAQPAAEEMAQVVELHRRLGVRPLLVAAQPHPSDAIAPLPADLLHLVERMLGLRPRLGIVLAQEVPGCRPLIVQRVLRTGALMAALMGAEPLPLLDLPLHVAVNWKMALEIAAIYGHPGLDYRSREMLGTLTLNLAVRTVAQQLLKLAPLVGWLLSAALSGSSAWLLGRTLVRYYEQERFMHLALPRPTLPRLPLRWGRPRLRWWRKPDKKTDEGAVSQPLPVATAPGVRAAADADTVANGKPPGEG
jgi:uncharacterized protein (DUF697 family)